MSRRFPPAPGTTLHLVTDIQRTPLPELDRDAAEAFWQRYLAASGVDKGTRYTDLASFGDSVELADELLDLILMGRKRATSGSIAEYELEGVDLPKAGDRWIACDGRRVPRAVIETTEVRVGPLSSVDDQFAWDEGEGDRTRDDWLRGHTEFFQRTHAESGLVFHPDIPVAFERFDVAYREPATPHGHQHHERLSSAGEWDERYRGDGSNIWSGQPNEALIVEAADLPVGRAVDLGCGEGADAVWLATRGWDVTGIDISSVALNRARSAARNAAVDVEWIHADFAVSPPESGAFDLVISFYPALLKTKVDESIAALLLGVAPGGTLLFVWHAMTDSEVARSHGFEPDDYVQIDDVVTRLGDGWDVVVNETRPRDLRSENSPHHEDTVLKAIRRA